MTRLIDADALLERLNYQGRFGEDDEIYNLLTNAPAVEQSEPVGDKQTPYSNCQFQICDLPGQCRGEGKCHHPAYTSPISKEWVGLSDADIIEGIRYSWVDRQAFESVAWWADEKLKQLNAPEKG